MKPITRRWVGLAVLAALMLPAPALARRRVRIAGRGLTGGRKTYTSPNVLKPEELRACLQQEVTINEMGDRIDADEVVLQQRADQVDQMGRSLEARQSRVDLSSKDAVDAYNREVARHRNAIAEYNRQLTGFNAGANGFNNRVQEFNTICAGKSYYEEDMQTARAALGLSKTP